MSSALAFSPGVSFSTLTSGMQGVPDASKTAAPTDTKPGG
jgi:hypothetical protein